MRKANKLFSLMLAAVMTVTTVPSVAMAADKDIRPTSITGERTEDGKAWQFVIPDDASGEVVLDFSDYLDAVIRVPEEQGRNWDQGRNATIPFSIKNESGRVYKYADADFTLDMNAESDDDIYYISGKSPYGERPSKIGYHSAVRTLNQPIQSLYGKGSDRLTTEDVVKVEDKIKEHGEVKFGEKTEVIPDTVNTYAEYALWFYNTFLDAGASSLSDLPLVYKFNILGYANAYDKDGLNQGNISVKEEELQAKGMTDEEIEEQLIRPRNELIEGIGVSKPGIHVKRGEDWAWASYSCVIFETDPEIIKLAQDVFYQYGLRFTFNADADYDKVIFNDRANSKEEQIAQWEKWLEDEGELGWSTLCQTEFDVDTLKGESLSYAQQSVKNAIGSLRLASGENVDFDKAYITMPGYAVVNAHTYMGAMKGLGLNVTLKAVEDGVYDTEALELTKKVEGAELQDGQFEFALSTEAEDGIHFENATARNDKDGKIDFGDIRFDKAGEYVVSVQEVIPEDLEEGWKYDDSVKEFLFVVTEEDFGYKIEAGAKEEKAEFVNEFTPKEEVPEKEDEPKQDPPKEEQSTPKTGDTANVMLYAGLVILAAGVVIVTILRRRTHR